MINTSLRHNKVMKKFSMSDAKEFMLIADKNSDNKVSKVELFELFKNVMRK